MTKGNGERTAPPQRRIQSTNRIPLPKRPYRDSAIFYGVLAAIVVGVAYATAGALLRSVVIGVGFFVIATAWSWWRFRQQLEAQQAEAEARRSSRRGR
jgi:predicted tellurium resistance membrane protein TerC